MRDTIETIVFSMAIIVLPVTVYDLTLNQGRWISILARQTPIDEWFLSLLRLFF